MRTLPWICLSAVIVCACRRPPPPQPGPDASPTPAPATDLPAAVSPASAATVTEAEPLLPPPNLVFPPGTVEGTPPPVGPPGKGVEQPLEQVAARLLQLSETKTMPGLEELLSEGALRKLTGMGPTSQRLPVLPGTLRERLGGRITRVVYQGGRATIVVEGPRMTHTSWFFLENGRWKLELTDSRPLLPPAEGPPDPLNQPISLQEATKGIAGTGPLRAILETTAGTVHCTLFEDKAPRSVATFVGLARGLRASRKVEGGKLMAKWQKKRFYDGMVFFRTVPGYLAQAGDPLGKGLGNAGFQIEDELDLSLRHDRPGALGLANVGPNTGSSQFYVTVRPAPQLDDRFSLFGLCDDLAVVEKIAQASPGEVKIKTVRFERAAGQAAK